MAFSTILLLALLTAPVAVCVQDPAAPPSADSPQTAPENDGFFSGNVVELTSDRVSVTRTILNKRPEKRSFRINAGTKVEGKLKVKSRVTVRYAPEDDGDVALSILVRPDRSSDSKKK
ncbi:MAG: hypothetical protein JSU00_24100 [Acidobacteria bacterium]|nr:hypothetical protein [Acidobacteriota bacterium]